MNMQVKKLEQTIDDYYNSINENSSAREVAERIYAVIGIKRNNSSLLRYRQPLYLDVKHFIFHHLKSFDTEDYGYDIPNNDKVLEAIDALPTREQLAICRYACKLYENCGYEISFLDKKINRLRMEIAWKENQYFSSMLRLSALNVWTLLLSYFIFFVVLYVVLLPAPFEWMGIIKVEPHDFGLNPFKNQLLNVLALMADENFSPEIVPCGLRGMMLVIFGKILFFLLIGNFIVKKLSDFFSFE